MKDFTKFWTQRRRNLFGTPLLKVCKLWRHRAATDRRMYMVVYRHSLPNHNKDRHYYLKSTKYHHRAPFVQFRLLQETACQNYSRRRPQSSKLLLEPDRSSPALLALTCPPRSRTATKSNKLVCRRRPRYLCLSLNMA